MTTRKPFLSSQGIQDAATKRAVDSIAQSLEILRGQRGNTLDRAVTLRELSDANVVQIKTAGGRANITRPDSVPLAAPKAISGLSASGGFQSVIVTWNLPAEPNLVYTEVYASNTDNLGTAALTARVPWPGITYADNLGQNAARYYWARSVNANGDPGPWNAVAGTPGQTSRDPAQIMDQVTSQSWQPAHVYVNAEVVAPSAPVVKSNVSLVFQVTSGGTSGASEPDWLSVTGNGDTIVDGGVTWQAVEAGTAPFVIGTVDGQQVVAMSSAMIQDAAITNAKIKNATIDSAKIANLAADKLTAGTINAAQIYLGANNVELDGAGSRIRVYDDQSIPVERVRLGKTGTGAQDYGLIIRDASGNIVFSVDGAYYTDGTQIDALQPGEAGADATINHVATYLEAFNTLPDLSESSGNGTAEITTGGVTGKNVFQITNHINWFGAIRKPIDPNKLYLFRARIRVTVDATSTQQPNFLGIRLYDNSDKAISNIDQIAPGITLYTADGWNLREVWVGGVGTGGAGTQSNPYKFPAGTVSFAPRWLANHNSDTSGQVSQLDMFQVVQAAGIEESGTGVQAGDNRNLPFVLVANGASLLSNVNLGSSDAGSSATITIQSGWSINVGGVTLSSGPSGSITGRSFSTTYHVGYDVASPNDLSGGSFVATTNRNTAYNAKNRIYLGQVNTVADGGTGGGALPCVSVNAVFPDGAWAGDIAANYIMQVVDPENGYLHNECVMKSEPHLADRVRVSWSDDCLECSTSAPLWDGSQYVLAPNAESIAIWRDGEVVIEPVTVEQIARGWVQHIYVRGHCFPASMNGRSFALHHNAKEA